MVEREPDSRQAAGLPLRPPPCLPIGRIHNQQTIVALVLIKYANMATGLALAVLFVREKPLGQPFRV
jgi:hypothetical protein